MKKYLVLSTLVAIISSPFYASATTFLDFNESGANDTTWPGWTYLWDTSSNPVNYGHPFFYKTNGTQYYLQKYPELAFKGDYGNNSNASLDPGFRAPSTSTGGSFKVYDLGTGISANLGNGQSYDVPLGLPIDQPSWWLWQDLNNIKINLGITASYDRFSNYIYLNGPAPFDGTNPNSSETFEWGTFNCWAGGGAYGESCPTEASNAHYYHEANIQYGAWVHILWDKHPTHQRNVQGSVPPNNPTSSSGQDYFETLFKWYNQFAHGFTTMGYSFWMDELLFTSATDLGEPNQNDISIASLWTGYWPSDSHWEIGWNDLKTLDNHDSEYEIRWSTAPITNANYANATPLTPLANVSVGNKIHKANTYTVFLWTKFKLPAGTETNNNKLYFAVKDVSVAGGMYLASSSANIHTVDYSIRPLSGTADTTTPAAPTGLRVR